MRINDNYNEGHFQGPNLRFGSFRDQIREWQEHIPSPFSGESGRRFRECLDNWQTLEGEVNFLQRNNSPSRAANQADVAVGLSNLTRRMLLPASTPQVFSGTNIDDYLPFVTAFDNLIVSHCASDQERYQYLGTSIY